MDFYKEIIVNLLRNEDMHVSFPNLRIDANQLVELTCYNTLMEIKRILNATSLDDPSCFQKIEEIVLLFEKIGSNGGSRHDF